MSKYLQNLFVGRLNRKGFWTTIVVTFIAVHAFTYLLNALAGWTSLSNMYGGTSLLEGSLFYIDPASGSLWQLMLVGWLVGVIICTGAFTRRLRDASLPTQLSFSFPIILAWLTFVGFGPWSSFLDNSPFWWIVLIVWAAGIFVIVASLLPSKK